MKHRKDKFLLGVFLGILMVTMAVLSGCGAKAEPKPARQQAAQKPAV